MYFLGAEIVGKKTFLKLKLLFKEIKYLHTFMENGIVLLVFYAESKHNASYAQSLGGISKMQLNLPKSCLPVSLCTGGHISLLQHG